MAILRRDPKSKASRKVSLASLVGTTIEWYDFYLFGTASALFFNTLFFLKSVLLQELWLHTQLMPLVSL